MENSELTLSLPQVSSGEQFKRKVKGFPLVVVVVVAALLRTTIQTF